MMLAPQGRLSKLDETAAYPERAPGLLDSRSFLRFLRRRAGLIATVTLAAIALAGLAIVLLPPRYTALAVLLVDPRQQRVAPSEAVLAGIGNDSAAVESQVEVLESRMLAKRVIGELGLDRDPDFTRPSRLGGLVDALRGELGLEVTPETPDRVGERALTAFREDLKVLRRGQTYVLEVTFVASTAEKAARIANAVAEDYLSDQVTAKLEATTRAATWLGDRSGDLRERLTRTERAVADFKAQHNIIDTAEGKTLADRQIADLSQQLILARARTAEARSRLDQALKASTRAGTLGNIPEALQSPVIANLRAQYAQVTRSEADAISTFGNRHPALETIRSQLQDVRRQIEAEVARIAAGLRNEFEAAQTRERSLDASMTALKRQSGAAQQTAVRLRELESDAQATRAVMEQLLLRSRETSEQENLQRPDARIISQAAPPLRPSFPKPSLMLALAAVGGLILGLGTAALADGARRGFRTARQVEAALLVPVLGSLPLVSSRELRLAHETRKSVRLLGSGERGEASGPMSHADRVKRFGLDRQLTPFGEALRAIRTRLTGEMGLESGSKVILVMSALTGEGKSTVAANLAHSLARSGLSTLLVDVDVRRSTMEPPRPGPSAGLLQVLRDNADLDTLLVIDRGSGLHTLPAGPIESVADASELLAGKPLMGLLERLRRRFEVIVLDGPPILPFADGRQILNHADMALLVVAWGTTDRDSVAAVLETLGPNADKIVGAVLNRVDERAYPAHDTDYGYQTHAA